MGIDIEKAFEEHSSWPKMAAAHWTTKVRAWGVEGLDYEDLLQIAACGMCKGLRTYDPEKSALRTWIHVHINNEILTEIRKTKKAPKAMTLSPVNHDGEDIELEIPVEEYGFESVDNRTVIDEIHALLTEREFKILWMSSIDQLSQHQIASVIGVQQPQIYRILQIIKKKVYNANIVNFG